MEILISIIVFIIVLSVIVLAHELGHYSVARKAGVRVDEFGIGYPPRVAKLFTYNGTLFSLNALPLGGFVRIAGEDNETESTQTDTLTSKNIWTKLAILFAGIIANLILAWLLIFFGYIAGAPISVEGGLPENLSAKVTNPVLTVVDVVSHKSAATSGIRAGDTIVSVTEGEAEETNLRVDSFKTFIASHKDNPITVHVLRGKEQKDFVVIPEISKDGVPLIGVSIDTFGTIKLPFGEAFIESFRTTYGGAKMIVMFIAGLCQKHSEVSFSDVSGPVGIFSIIKNAYALGIGYIVSVTASISLSLAVFNIVPIPALDGGRAVIAIIEAITKKRIKAEVLQWIHIAGFVLVMLLLVFATWHDIAKLL